LYVSQAQSLFFLPLNSTVFCTHCADGAKDGLVEGWVDVEGLLDILGADEG